MCGFCLDYDHHEIVYRNIDHGLPLTLVFNIDFSTAWSRLNVIYESFMTDRTTTTVTSPLLLQVAGLSEGGPVPLRQQSAHHREQLRHHSGMFPVQLHRAVLSLHLGRPHPLEQLLEPGLRLLPGPGRDQLEEGGADVQGCRLSSSPQ